jgi:hypothetical protein
VHEGKLEIERLFAPQRAVVVKRCNAQFGRYEVRRALRRHARDKIRDRFLAAPSFQEGRGSEACAKALPARLIASSAAGSARG